MITKKGYRFLAVPVLLSLSIAFFSPAAVKAAGIEVEKSAVCTGVEDLEPVGEKSTFQADTGKIYFWTKIRSETAPEKIKHVWYYKNEQMAEVPLDIKYKTMRTYSSKKIIPGWTGSWRVEAVDSDGNVLNTVNFSVGSKEEMGTTQEKKQTMGASESKMEDKEMTTEMKKETSSSGLEVEIKFGTSINDREISGESSQFSSGTEKIYCWSVINGAKEPTTVTHVWFYKDKKMAEIPLNIKYERHRAWTSKTIMPEWTGEWTVEVLDAKGNLLKEKSFQVQ